MSQPAPLKSLDERPEARHWVLALLGFFVGSGLGQEPWAALSGAGFGYLLSRHRSSDAELAHLRESVRRLSVAAPAEATAESQPAVGAATEPGPAATPEAREPAGPMAAAVEAGGASAERPAWVTETAAASRAARASRAEGAPASVTETKADPGPGMASRLAAGLGSFFLGGNTVARTGLLILLVGLTLLAKYAVDHALFPIEARLAFGALVGLGLVAFGYRQRTERRGFSMTLQGGGVAALYLITFSAFRVYALIPAPLAFGLFVALAFATGVLSVKQKAEPLIVIGSLGGFLAPVLASTGAGNHVALFSYYLLLVASIALVAWREAWRVPARVAFVCTYLVAGAWGALRYQAEDLATTMPFVLAFLGLFTGVAILHSLKPSAEKRGVVDGTLVFGTAFVTLVLQAALVRDIEMGLAFSAVGMAAFYLLCALFLKRRADAELQPLIKSFVVLAVGFATMAIPFAFDEALTTAIAWSLEGAALYWLGARQSRGLPRLAGLVLQPLAALAFAASVALEQIDPASFVPLANGRALSCLSLALAGMLIARTAESRRDGLSTAEVMIAQAAGIIGLLWWTGGVVAEIDQFVPGADQVAVAVACVAMTGLALEWLSARFAWDMGRRLALASLPAGIVMFVIALDAQPHLFAGGGIVAWPLLVAALFVLWSRQGESDGDLALLFRDGCLWLVAAFSTLSFAGFAEDGLGLSRDWVVAALGAGLAIFLLTAFAAWTSGRAPFERERERGLRFGLAPVFVLGVVVLFVMQFSGRGDAAPLPHLPILNPVDLATFGLGLALLSGGRSLRSLVPEGEEESPWPSPWLLVLGAGLAFVWGNGLFARAVHQWTGVAFTPEALWDSVAFQMTLSIAWTLVGLVGMLLASRKGWREAWIAFAVLLVGVVVKLFLVDLAQLSAIARIATFLVVGAMLLGLGYASPVPPAANEEIGAGEERA